jgi:hypothetical protein
MFTFSETFWQSKTTWTSIGAILVALWQAFHHQISWGEAWSAIGIALQAVNIRDAVAKSASK